jgi:hypothetical protein
MRVPCDCQGVQRLSLVVSVAAFRCAVEYRGAENCGHGERSKPRRGAPVTSQFMMFHPGSDHTHHGVQRGSAGVWIAAPGLADIGHSRL